MTVKIGMGGSALDLSDAQVWGNPVQKIMLGLGNTAALAWQRVGPLQPYNNRITSNVTIPRSAWTVLQEHTVVGEGPARISIEWRFNSTPLFFSQHWRYINVTVNDQAVGLAEEQYGQAGSWSGTSSVSNVYLNEGDVVKLRAWAEAGNTNLRTVTLQELDIAPM